MKKSHEVSARKNNNRLRYNKKCRGGRIPPPALLGLIHKVKYYPKSSSVHGTLGTDFEYVTFVKGPQPTTQDKEKTVNKTK